jgi:DMSO/TMAO reductase YedYZ molybdopterin-dependent catalytic subunit
VWTGTPLKDLLEEAGLQDKAIELLFTGLDKGLQGGEMQYYQRCLTIDDATREEVRRTWPQSSVYIFAAHVADVLM